tara:strand:- start:2309 stop:3763 length:1455 start_codon:yes stop_codon:yes gene_type:complete
MAYTTITDPSAYFQTKTYTGTGSSNAITNDGNSNLRPDWVWGKARNQTYNHNSFDSNRGFTKRLTVDGSDAENTDSTTITAQGADGFTLGSSANLNGNSVTYVAWQWAAGGATPSQTYKVVVVSDSGNKYRFRNSADNATYAASAVSLSLQQGGTYTFDQSDSSVASHPMKFSTTSDGTHGGGSSYNTGVTYKLDGSTVTESAYVSGFASATTRQIILNPQNTTTLYYYCHYHSGMGGQADQNATFGSTNFDGSLLTKVSANTTAGFSIVTYTGNASAGATIGHGLGATPAVVFVKTRSISFDWYVYHKDIGNGKYLEFNTTNGEDTRSGAWNDTSPTSTVITLGSDDGANDNAGMVAYCFSEVKGYSKIGDYQGNGSNTGPYVYTGFKPAIVMLKRTDSTGHWHIFDKSRNETNVANRALFASSNGTEAVYAAGGGDPQIDINSNGFCLRSNYNQVNADNGMFTYMAFAKNPLVAGGAVATGG